VLLLESCANGQPLLGYNFLTPRAIPNKDMSDCLNRFITPLAVAEPVAMYSLLALSSFHYETAAGSLSSRASYEASHSLLPLEQRPDYVIYKQRSISLVNQYMANPVDAISQKTVFAIICLVALQAHVCGTSNVSAKIPFDTFFYDIRSFNCPCQYYAYVLRFSKFQMLLEV
jgi:hypothetical protein